VIVIPMLGKSSRFFEAGYTLPKYQLPLGNETVFAKSVRTFEKQFSNTPFLFLIRADHNALEFVAREIVRLGIKDFRIKELDYETRGQAESVAIGIADYDEETPLLIFNIDTIRLNFEVPNKERYGDGFLEVFQAEGYGWSFVEAGIQNNVLRTTEKQRISNLCSNGMYGFAKCRDFKRAYYEYLNSGEHINGELYIAPLYNTLIKHGFKIGYIEVESENIFHCGIPADYANLVEKINI
jgi:hypothetical protein